MHVLAHLSPDGAAAVVVRGLGIITTVAEEAAGLGRTFDPASEKEYLRSALICEKETFKV